MNEEYVNMKTLARLFVGATSHKIGKELRHAGYRNERGDPNRKAICSGMAIIRRNAEHREWKENLWNVEKVCELLQDFGWVRVVNDE